MSSARSIRYVCFTCEPAGALSLSPIHKDCESEILHGRTPHLGPGCAADSVAWVQEGSGTDNRPRKTKLKTPKKYCFVHIDPVLRNGRAQESLEMGSDKWGKSFLNQLGIVNTYVGTRPSEVHHGEWNFSEYVIRKTGGGGHNLQ